jgi:DNA polymerase I-like protein with 3'-5' exonuclease and polymerase domains
MEPSEEAQLRELVTKGMVGALELPCPIEIEIGLGENWLEAH